MPCLVSPSVGTMLASASILAVWAEKLAGWALQARRRERLTASCRAMTEAGSKRRRSRRPWSGRGGSQPRGRPRTPGLGAAARCRRGAGRRIKRCRRCSARGRTRSRDGGLLASGPRSRSREPVRPFPPAGRPWALVSGVGIVQKCLISVSRARPGLPSRQENGGLPPPRLREPRGPVTCPY